MNVFLMGLTWLTEVNMDIHQTRSNHKTSRIDNLGISRIDIFSNFNDFFSVHKNIGLRVQTRFRVNNTTIFNQ